MSIYADHDDGSATFTRTPNELKLMIAEQLGIHDVNALARTCREMNELLTPNMYRRAKDSKGKRGRPYFLRAVDRGCLRAVERFVEVGADVYMTDRFRGLPPTAIHSCAHFGHVDIAGFLIGQGIDIPAIDGVDFGVLHSLVSGKDPKEAMATLLVEAGADPDAFRGLDTPLHRAAMGKNVRLVQHLLDLGADPNAVDEMGARAAYNAAAYSTAAMIQFLLGAAPNVAITDIFGHTPLHTAARCGTADIVKVLLEMGADVSSVDSQGWTPLHCAVNSHGNEATVHRILRLDASKTYTCGSRCRSIETNHPKIELLLDAGADIAAPDNYGRSPLTWATDRHPTYPTRPVELTYE